MSRGSQIRKWSAATAFELLARGQHGVLDAVCIAESLQDELVSGGGAALALLDLGQIAIDGDRAPCPGVTFAHLEPAAVRPMLEQRLARIAMQREALAEPAFALPPRVGNEAVLDGVADDLLEGRAGFRRPVAMVEQLGIFVIAEHEPVVLVEQREAFRDGLDGVGQALLALGERLLLGGLARGDLAPGADHFQGIAVPVAHEVLLVADPAIDAVLLAEAIFGEVPPLLEELRLLGLDLGKVFRVHAGAPEVRLLQIVIGLVAQHALNIVADEGRRVIAARLEAVDHGRRAVQQQVEAGAGGVFGLLRPLCAR